MDDVFFLLIVSLAELNPSYRPAVVFFGGGVPEKLLDSLLGVLGREVDITSFPSPGKC